MDYEQIFNWTAKRAGGRITVYGENRNKAAVRVVGVDRIAADRHGALATDKNGNIYRLMPA